MELLLSVFTDLVLVLSEISEDELIAYDGAMGLARFLIFLWDPAIAFLCRARTPKESSSSSIKP